MTALEIIVLVGAVAVVAGVIARSVWKKARGKGCCCGCDCSACGCCPHAKKQTGKDQTTNPNK